MRYLLCLFCFRCHHCGVKKYAISRQYACHINRILVTLCHVLAINTKNIAFRRSILLDVGLFNRHVRTLENFDMILRLKKYGHKVHQIQNVKVQQDQKNNFRKIFCQKKTIGKWIFFTYYMNKDMIQIKDEMIFRPLWVSEYLLFIPKVLLVLFREGISAFIFEVVSGAALRIGILNGFLRKKRFLSSIQANYD